MHAVRGHRNGHFEGHRHRRQKGPPMRMNSRVAVRIALGMTLLVPAAMRAQATSPLDDMLKTATKALEVFNYRQADSISRSVLAFGSVLTKQQRALALQVSIAAVFPEDKPNERQTDS